MRVSLISTGGTIASRRGELGLVVADGVADLMATLPSASGAEIVPVEFSSRSSYSLSVADMLATVRRIRLEYVQGSQAVVITHGTDTLEEMAFLCGQYFSRDTRLVLTGAQRAADVADGDGARNLADALIVATSPAQIGPVIVMGGQAIAAVEGRKVHTSSLIAFSGGAAGASALVESGMLLTLSTPSRGGLLADEEVPEDLPRVDLITMAAGADGTHLFASIAAGAQGVVIEAFGNGNVNALVLEAVETAVGKGVAVLITSRAGNGLVQPLYGDGGGADLARAGALFAGDLTGSRARIALALALAHSHSEDGVTRILHRMIRGDVPC